MSENMKRMQNIVGSFVEKSLKIPAYDGFSKSACIAIFLAHEEAAKLHQGMVSPEALLLGLFSEESGVAGQTLKAQGVSLKDARSAAEKIGAKGNSNSKAAEIPLTPQATAILVAAEGEAAKLYHNPTDTEHILLALMNSENDRGLSGQLLERLGIDSQGLRSVITGDFDM